jgi:dTDP-4-amino-4,6-dideoxygalactose transaminase
MNIPFLDLKSQFGSIEDEIRDAIEPILQNNAFVLGPAVESFEHNYEEYCRVKHCVGVSSGTAALHLALLAYDIGPGDDVITTPPYFCINCVGNFICRGHTSIC